MTVETVRAHLERFGAAERILSFDASTATVDLAAAAVGVEPDRIAKTLAIRVKGEERVLIVVATGLARLDNAKFKAAFGGKPSFIASEQCLDSTGHPPGGVCPFGLKAGVEVFLDQSLKKHPSVFPAAGLPNNCVETTSEELTAWTGGTWIDVCR